MHLRDVVACTVVAPLLLAVPLRTPAGGQSAAYEWRDGSGSIHFTDDLTRVPEAYRGQVDVIPLPAGPAAPEAAKTPTRPVPPEAPAVDEETTRADAYAECMQKVEERDEAVEEQLRTDEARLEELNRLIHRSATSRHKNRFQRERVQVRERIRQAQDLQLSGLPAMKEACERQRNAL